MEDPEGSDEDVAARHRREKKQLQGRILALKKSSGKLDKKKRKELDETIAKLEDDLRQAHLKELAEPNETQPADEAAAPEVLENCEENPDEEASGGRGRVSKAQRRREKKAAEESERARLIAEQERANVNAPGAVETRTVRELLRKMGLALHSVPSDGDCLYAAVSHQLEHVAGVSRGVAALRRLTAAQILSHRDEYEPFACDPRTGDPLAGAQFDAYCSEVERTSAWGGELELRALAAELKRCIRVVQASPPHVIAHGEEHAEESPLVVAYHRHLYGLGEHYNSTKRLPRPAEDDGHAEEKAETR